MQEVLRWVDSKVQFCRLGCGLDNRGKGYFSSPRPPDRLRGPPSLVTIRYRSSFRGGKAASAEVKNACGYASSPPHLIMKWCFITYRDNFSGLLHMHGTAISWKIYEITYYTLGEEANKRVNI
jgi:hypothetical protein